MRPAPARLEAVSVLLVETEELTDEAWVPVAGAGIMSVHARDDWSGDMHLVSDDE